MTMHDGENQAYLSIAPSVLVAGEVSVVGVPAEQFTILVSLWVFLFTH